MTSLKNYQLLCTALLRSFSVAYLAAVIAVLAISGRSTTAETFAADRPPAFVPLGAYLSWERTDACAKANGIDRWADVARRLDALRKNHVNLLWVTNMDEVDLPRLIAECEKRDMRLLSSMGAVEAKLDWRWADDGTYYNRLLPQLVATAGGSSTLIGWVLSDEPLAEHLPRVETLRKKFRELDPDRFTTAVTMWPQTPLVPAETKLPIVVMDLYPFFGPNDPNGPHTDAASKGFFRNNMTAMMKAIGDGPASAWVMGMCFSDIWGPREYNAEGHLIGLPGSYLHWRCPTPAEMRWQVWESFRGGAKGFVCYTVAPEAPDPATSTLPPADVAWKEVLATEPTDLGPNALTNPDGSSTPQLEELGRVYAQLAPHADLLLRLKRTDIEAMSLEGPGAIQGFVDPDTGARYAIIVNDDLHERQALRVAVPNATEKIEDLLEHNVLPLTERTLNESRKGTLVLHAGSGTLLGIR
ncbi:MAG: hypothetical protein JNK74_25405 [Candidatus Hydrogenedentes bacterium]|nr:hypothetical protein [Candidatus Hydrogenedentota bacterium]